jgi:hypothetical protein
MAGMGSIGTGRGGIDPPLVARDGAAVTWPDGSAAGTVARGGAIAKSALSDASGDRQCASIAPFTTPLCLAKRDLCAAPGCAPRPRP